MTELEVTTGELDSSSPAPGRITKLQLKAFNAAGDDAWTKSYTGLASGGYVHYTYDHFLRGTPLQVQANIHGIDGDRTNDRGFSRYTRTAGYKTGHSGP